MWQVCTMCNKHKALWEFNKHKGHKFGIRAVCKICSKLQDAQRYKDNRETIIKQKSQYYYKNKDRYMEWHADYYKRNKYSYTKRQELYRKNNREYFINYRINNRDSIRYKRMEHYKNNKVMYYVQSAKRRATKLNQTPDITDDQKLKLLLYYKIAQFMGSDWHVDHIVPLCLGGLHHPDNLQIITATDNLQKGSKLNYDLKGPSIRI